MSENKSMRKVVELSIDDILPNRYQPRIKFDDTAIFELSESIKNHGVFQPIIVRPIGDKYEIIAGERRYKASVLANKTTIPAIIMNLNDKDTIEIALIENVQRANLTPIEEAISYRKILDMGYIKQEDLARKLGKTQSTVANKLRLLNLDEEVQEALLENKISERHARSLLRIKDADEQKIMLKRIINERLTVRKTDEEIDKMMNNNMIETNPIMIEDNATPVFEESVPEVQAPTFVEETNPSSIFGFGGPQVGIETPVNNGVNDSTVISSEESQIIEPVQASQFDINGMQNNAAPVFEEKPVANMDQFLNTQEVVTVEPAIQPEPTGRFFDFTPATQEAPVVEQPKGNEGFTFNNFISQPSVSPAVNGTTNIAVDVPETNNTAVEFNNFVPVENTQISNQVVETTINNPVEEDIIIPSIKTESVVQNNDDFVIPPISVEGTQNAATTVEEQPEPIIPTVMNEVNTVVNESVLEEPTIPVVPTINATQIEEEPIISTVSQESVEENIPNAAPKNVMKAVNVIRDAVEELNRLGYMVDVDEIDLESMYQLIIKIDK